MSIQIDFVDKVKDFMLDVCSYCKEKIGTNVLPANKFIVFNSNNYAGVYVLDTENKSLGVRHLCKELYQHLKEDPNLANCDKMDEDHIKYLAYKASNR